MDGATRRAYALPMSSGQGSRASCGLNERADAGRLPSFDIPTPQDAPARFDFVVEQQARTYAGIVRPDFATLQRAGRTERVSALVEEFANPGTARRLVAREGGAIVAVASIQDAPASWERELGLLPAPAGRCLDRLYLHPDLHGRGLGSRLLAAVDDGRPLYLWLIDGNAAAQAFYRRRGFVDEHATFGADASWGDVSMHRMARLTTASG